MEGTYIVILAVCLVSWLCVHQTMSVTVNNGQGYIYYVSETKMNRVDAEIFCNNTWNVSKGHLLSISDREEYNFLQSHAFTRSNDSYWIGLIISVGIDAEICGCRDDGEISSSCDRSSIDICCQCRYEWGWSDGTEMTFLRWMINEPTGGQKCARMAHITAAENADVSSLEDGFYWYDKDCEDEFKFICKAYVGYSTTTRTNDAQVSNPDPHKQGKSKINDNMIVGISIGVVTVALAIAAVVIAYMMVRRYRRKAVEKKYVSSEHTYYNAKQIPTENDVIETTEYANEMNNDNDHASNNNYKAHVGTSYAEIVTPSGSDSSKPKPISPKPAQVKDVQYADIDFGTDNPKPSGAVFNAQQEATEYSSAGSMYNKKISYDDSYADVDGINSSQKPHVMPASQGSARLHPLNKDQLSAMYAQPMKKPKSPKVMHKPAPNNDTVEYALPMK